MTNEQLIQERWKYTDNLLKQYQKKFQSIFNDIKDELVELFNELTIERDSLNKTVSSSIKRKLDRSIKEWKKEGIITPYFQFLINTTTKYIYSNVLKLFVFAIYMKYQKREFDECKSLLVSVANSTYNQASKELRQRPKRDLLWANIRDWTIVHTINVSLEEYLEILNQEASEEASRLMINYINQEIKLDISGATKMIEKQLHRLISVKNDKFSGILENLSRQVGNYAYFKPFPNQKVRFIAEMDDKTTLMCKSLNNQIFNTIDKNIFYRYSADAHKNIKYEIDGLITGINLPPISDHFHWCRSTITYQVN